MFRLDDKPHEFEWPVLVKVPKDGGGFQTREFTARFRVRSQDDIDEISNLAADVMDDRMVNEVLIGWKSVEGVDGEELPFNEENRGTLLGIPYVRMAVLRAYFNALQGIDTKN